MSLPPAADAPAAPAYGLTPPTEVDFQVALRRQLGAQAADAAWEAACRACSLPVRGRAPSAVELQRVAEHLVRERGAIGGVGRSMLVRVRTYALLVSRIADTARREVLAPSTSMPAGGAGA